MNKTDQIDLLIKSKGEWINEVLKIKAIVDKASCTGNNSEECSCLYCSLTRLFNDTDSNSDNCHSCHWKHS